MSLVTRPLVTVDARMLLATGIGTYLRALLPRVIARTPDARFCLLGRTAELERAGLGGDARVELRQTTAGIYSPREQPELWWRTPRETRVFWAPHVNAPLAGPGRLLATVHDAFYAKPPPGAVPRLDKLLYLKLVQRGVQRRARAVLCVSAFTKGELERLLGPFRGPLHVVPNGVDASWFERPAAPSPHPRPYLLYVGNLKPHKNLPRTLAAFASIAGRVPHDFVLVGPGDPEPLRAALPGELATRVRFEAPLDQAGLERTVAHASGLVLASLYEGFGLPPLEAMALGIPVLVSRTASLPEVCGDAALYCDPLSVADIAGGLVRLLTDDAERLRLAAAGPPRARRFDWDRSADQVSAVLRELL
ncbi:MAG TPA: glycosyltransferase family 1 protein [Polyangiaceae bacterium]|nr:glycosyltransferase family 1 protein [Polyangiaceae bacterium]